MQKNVFQQPHLEASLTTQALNTVIGEFEHIENTTNIVSFLKMPQHLQNGIESKKKMELAILNY